MSDNTANMSLEDAVEGLLSSQRRQRQNAAHCIRLIASDDPSLLTPYISALLDGLDRPEAQTRWEIFHALSFYASLNGASLVSGVEAAETALFDEDSAPVRLSAFVFLCRLGAFAKAYSLQVWPLLDEAIQCYHGSAEYVDMLQELALFIASEPDDAVVRELKDRLRFDAEHGFGSIRVLSQRIVSYGEAIIDPVRKSAALASETASEDPESSEEGSNTTG